MRDFSRVLVTGGCGFIGSNFIRFILKETDWEIINLDALTYAGNLENLADIADNPRYRFVWGRIEDSSLVNQLMQEVDLVVNFAAESHVDRSIHSAIPFIRTNVEGTQVLLDGARLSKRVKLFLHISTDEVYGSLKEDEPPFNEQNPLKPNSPYSASKAASDMLVRACFKTHGLPCIITRCSNNYGPYQFPEKLIPLMILNALDEKPLPIYGDGLNIRDWIYVLDHCSGILSVIEKGEIGSIYNLGGECEKTNLDVVKTILNILGKSESLIQFVKDRPGHDRRYAMDISLAKRELNWSPKVSFEKGLEDTIDWYIKNKKWWQRIRSGQYLKFYEQHYNMLGLKEK